MTPGGGSCQFLRSIGPPSRSKGVVTKFLKINLVSPYCYISFTVNGIFYPVLNMWRDFNPDFPLFCLQGFFNKFKKTPDLQWTIPVQPYRDEQPSANVCYTIRWSQLKPYFQKNCNLKNGSKVKYTWSTRISIFRAD